MEVDVPVTELEEFEPDRVDGVKAGANGFPILMMKGLVKADAEKCPTCDGSGKIMDGHRTCPDCKGSGDATAEKAELDADARNNLDDSDFAYIDAKGGRHLPIHDAAHVRAALARFGQTQFDNAADKKATAKRLVAAAKKFDIDISDDTAVDAAAKSADEPVEKDGVVSGANPLFGAVTPQDASVPGSPSWESTDADTAAQAAQALMAAAECIRTFAAREGAEVAAGEGSDLFDEFDALVALDQVTCALGIMARLAFLEGNAANKGADDAEKAGKVLSTKSVDAIRAAITALNDLLSSAAGGSKPTDGEDAAEKSQEDILAMTKDELIALLDEREAAKAEAREAAKAEKAEARKAADDAKAAKKQAKAEKRASETPEEAEARKAAKAERREAKKAAKAEKQAAKEAAKAEQDQTVVKEAIETAVGQAVEAVKGVYEERLAKVEKMAAPGGPVKTRTPADLNKSAERDTLEMRAADLEERARRELDAEVRKGLTDRAKTIRARIAELAA